MELSMRDLFPACVAVLAKELRPIHYADLTRMALAKIGVRESQVAFKKEAENVREKLLMAGQRGTFYAGAPTFAGALRFWFVSDAQINMTLDGVRIPGSAQAGVDGAFDALMRSPYMMVHNRGLENTEKLNRVRSSGMVLEKHVTNWFNQEYPDFYGEAANAGIWQRPCSHDFTLSIGGRRFLIDVAGPDAHGQYGRRGRKHPTDLHLICRVDGDHCLWEGVVRGEGFNESIDPISIFSPTAFLVWLNCEKHKIHYKHVAPRNLNTA
jgi:hypothetical protein